MIYYITRNIQLQVFYTLDKCIMKAVEFDEDVKVNVVKQSKKQGGQVKKRTCSESCTVFYGANY
jgi:antitoxin component YwqK of YwqJK toxin-antitoxin module